MKKTMKTLAAVALCAVATVTMLSSCSTTKKVPSQQEIETKIISKWKTIEINGEDCLTNTRIVFTYNPDGTFYSSMSAYSEDFSQYVWANNARGTYSVLGNIMTQSHEDTGIATFSHIYSITDDHFVRHDFKISSESKEVETNTRFILKKVTADYSKDIIGLWEGVEITGDETYGNAEARIEYKADGTYEYYSLVNGKWETVEDAFNEYNVDGDWLATRWQEKGSDEMLYEWWDIDYIKGDEMKWSALREKEDGTRFTTTFTWKRVK